MENAGRLIVISGPSGSGKTTICERLIERAGCERVVTCTTRQPRGAETPGVDYHFLSREEFEEGIATGKFLEHADVFGNFYGTPRAPVEEGIAAGRKLLLAIDVQGAQQLRESGIEAMTSLFIEPPSMEELERRLRARATDGAAAVEKRLEEARREMAERSRYDARIVNDDLDAAVDLAIETLDLVGER